MLAAAAAFRYICVLVYRERTLYTRHTTHTSDILTGLSMSNIGQFKRHWGVYPRNPKETKKKKRRKQQKGRTFFFAAAVGQRLGLAAYIQTHIHRPSYIGDILKREREKKNTSSSNLLSISLLYIFSCSCAVCELLIMIGMLFCMYCVLPFGLLCCFF